MLDKLTDVLAALRIPNLTKREGVYEGILKGTRVHVEGIHMMTQGQYTGGRG